MNETTPQDPATPGGQQGTNQPFGAGFFTWLRGLGMVRGSDRWFAGVAGGIAAKANIDPIIVRGVFVVLAVLGGPGILLYLAGWLLLPDFTGKIHLEEVVRGRAGTAAIIVIVAVGLLVVVPFVFGVLTPWNWGVWGMWDGFGFPGWMTVTLQVLVWIAVLVGIALLVSRVALNHGRKVRAEQPFAPPAQAAPTAPAAPAAQAAPAASTPHAAFAASAAPTEPTAPSYAIPDTPAPGASPTWSTDPSAKANEWSKNFSEQANAWGNSVGEKAAAWGEDVGKQADEWSARYAEHYDAHKLGAAHTVLSIALALLTAGGGALWAWGSGATTSFVVTVSLVAAVATLAVSLIVAGLRGKHTGWVGFLAFCGAVAIAFTSIFPTGSQFQLFGNLTVTPGPPGAVLVAGNSDIELGSLDQTTSRQDLTVWHVAGTSRVELPAHHPVIVKVFVLAGNIEAPTGIDGAQRKSAGPFLTRTIDTHPEARNASTVSIYLIAGNVRVDEVPESALSAYDTRREAEADARANAEEAARERAAERAELEQELRDLQDEVADLQKELAS